MVYLNTKNQRSVKLLGKIVTIGTGGFLAFLASRLAVAIENTKIRPPLLQEAQRYINYTREKTSRRLLCHAVVALQLLTISLLSLVNDAL